MIAVPRQAETAGCCTSCGVDLEFSDFAVWQRARVCKRCLTDLKVGERKLQQAAADYEFAEWDREWAEGQRSPAAVVWVVAMVACTAAVAFSLLLLMVRGG